MPSSCSPKASPGCPSPPDQSTRLQIPDQLPPVKVLGHWAVKLVVAALVAAFAIVSFLGWNPHYWLRELQLIDVAAIMGATLVLMAGSKAGLQAIVISVIVLLASIPVWLPGNKLSTSGSQDSPGATQSAAPDNTNSSMPLDPGNTIAIWESSLPRLAVVDQNMMVTRKAAETFWGLKFSWTDPSALSSFGLESITVPGSATVYDEILFQYEGFTIHGDDPHCHPWTTGLGINCNVIYPINSSHRYGRNYSEVLWSGSRLPW